MLSRATDSDSDSLDGVVIGASAAEIDADALGAELARLRFRFEQQRELPMHRAHGPRLSRNGKPLCADLAWGGPPGTRYRECGAEAIDGQRYCPTHAKSPAPDGVKKGDVVVRCGATTSGGKDCRNPVGPFDATESRMGPDGKMAPHGVCNCHCGGGARRRRRAGT